MADEWTEIEATGFWAKWSEPGDEYTGIVRDYDPDEGATDYNKNVCGLIVLEDDDGELWRVSLDKGAIKDPVVAAARRQGMDFIDGTRMRIRFEGWETSKSTGMDYKTFSVAIANVEKPKPRKTARTPVGKAVQDKAGFSEPDEAPF